MFDLKNDQYKSLLLLLSIKHLGIKIKSRSNYWIIRLQMKAILENGSNYFSAKKLIG